MKKNSKLFFIDFDDTLFDTGIFKKELMSIFYDNKISNEEFNNSYSLFGENTLMKYNPYEQAKLLDGGNDKVIHSILRDIDIFLADTSNYVFEDSIYFLNKIKKMGHGLIMISYGDDFFQNKKICSSGLKDFFDEIIVTDRPKIEIIMEHKEIINYETVFLLDDHPIFLDDAHLAISRCDDDSEYKKINVIRINRGDRKHSHVKTNFNHQEFSNLREVFEKVC